MLKPLVGNVFSQIKGNDIGNSDGDSDKNGDNDTNKKSMKGLGGQLDTINQLIKTQKLYEEMLNEDNKKAPPAPADNTKLKSKPDAPTNTDQQKDDSGYTDQEVKKMKRLIEIMSN